MADKAEKIVALMLMPLFYAISFMTPKKNSLWLFGAWFGRRYEDSPRNLFERCYERNSPDVSAFWIYKGEKPVSEFVPASLFIKCYSLKGLWLQIRAKVFVLCVNSRDFNPGCLTRRSLLIQTWHGTPMKEIGYPVLKGSRVDRMLFWIRWYLTDNYRLVLSPSEFTDIAFSDAFQLPLSRMLRTPYPRCSSLFLSKDQRTAIRKNVFGVGEEEFLWVYMPTHRNEGRDAVQTGNGLRQLENAVAKYKNRKWVVVFKPHFYEEKYFIERQSVVVPGWPLQSEYSLYQMLGAVDGLVTDYSSIAYDFAVTGKPIVIFDFDLEEYRTLNRSLLRLPSEEFEHCVCDEAELGVKLAELSKIARGKDSVEFEHVSDRILDEIEQITRGATQ